jgi:crotonobetainyl-CoA:carnitine CoA-transferase CaiB-like acyl-CoA transferase
MDVTAGVLGACAVMTGLLHRQRTGEGQYIDVSQLEVATHGTIGEHLLEYSMNGNVRLPLGNRHWKFAPQGCYRCKGDDKWLTLTIRSEDEWRSFCRVAGNAEWKSDPRFATNWDRIEHHEELDRLIEEWTVFQDQYEALSALQRAGIPAGAVLSPADLSGNPHLKERHYFMTAEDGTEKIFMGMPFRLSRGNGRIRWRGPDLGKHNRYVICDLLGRHEKDIQQINEDQIGTAFDSE